jgi:hypothetical protein
MNNNYKNKESDILKVWEKAGETFKKQQLNKGKMETLLSKTSTEHSTGIKRLFKADAVFKVILIFGFIIVAALNLANIFVLITNLICMIIATLTIRQERILLEGLDELQDMRGNIRDQLELEIKYYQSNIFRHPFVLSISVFLFYILGSLIYHGIKYETIKPIEDVQDAIVLMVFLLFSTVFSFAVYYPFFISRINFLKQLLNDIDQEERVISHIDQQKARKRRSAIITSILIVFGVAVLILFILAFLY